MRDAAELPSVGDADIAAVASLFADPARCAVLLALVYAKNEQDDLSPVGKKVLNQLIDRAEAALRLRALR